MKHWSLRFVVVITIAIWSNGSAAGPTPKKLSVPRGFDIASAMTLLFGNYDRGRQSSTYDVPQSTILDLRGSSFERGDDIEVRPFWVSSATEDGTPEVVMLTYAVPLANDHQPAFAGDEPFSCHACIPLIGAAVFVESGGQWRIADSRTVVTRRGGWGQPPDSIRVVRVGPRRVGIEITDTFTATGETTTTKLILLPWAGKVDEALARITSDGNRGACGEDGPCYAHSKKLDFVAGKNPDYYDIVLALSGTDITDSDPPVTKAVRGIERLEFADGKYRTVSREGDITFLERSIK